MCPRPSESSSERVGSNKPDRWAALLGMENVRICGLSQGGRHRLSRHLPGNPAPARGGAAGRQGANGFSERAQEQSSCCSVCRALYWAKDTEINQTHRVTLTEQPAPLLPEAVGEGGRKRQGTPRGHR